MTSRLDLANNQYAAADPRRVLVNRALENGGAPATLGYPAIFEDDAGPWLAAIRRAVVDGALRDGHVAFQAILDLHY